MEKSVWKKLYHVQPWKTIPWPLDVGQGRFAFVFRYFFHRLG